jgi:hypothetical protein
VNDAATRNDLLNTDVDVKCSSVFRQRNKFCNPEPAVGYWESQILWRDAASIIAYFYNYRNMPAPRMLALATISSHQVDTKR